jgi:two-component system, cell cycle response regulator
MTGERVLVAAEDLIERSAVSWLLSDSGYAVTTFERLDGIPDGVADPPDFAFIALSRMEDQSVLERIRGERRWKDVPVMVAGTCPDRHDVARLIGAGAVDVVSRPIEAAELLGRLEMRLREHGEARAMRAALEGKERALERARDDVATTHEIVNIVQEVVTELSPAAVYRTLARRVAGTLGVNQCSVVLGAPGDRDGVVAAANENRSLRELPIELARYPEIIAALESEQPVLIEDAATDHRLVRVVAEMRAEGIEFPVRSAIAIPFAIDRWRTGVLFLRTALHERALTHEDAEFANLVVKAAVAAVQRSLIIEETRADNRRLEQLATTDALTRLPNRRAFLERLGAEFDRAQRYGKVITLLVIDADHFKGVNDAHGHLCGDRVLAQLASLLQSTVRTVDAVARYGGEEFVAVLPETRLDGAVIFAERLREAVERHSFSGPNGAPLSLTISIGVAAYPADGVNSSEDLIARADEALYRAKSGGRNQVRT